MKAPFVDWPLPSAPSANCPQLAAFALIRDSRGCILLAHRTDVDVWNLPGGGVDPFENPERTVVREVAEEVGLIVEARQLLGVYPIAIDGSPGRATWVFDCKVLGGELRLTEEADAIGWFDPARLPANTWPRHRQRIADGVALLAGHVVRVEGLRPQAEAAILFGGSGPERRVSVASAQRLAHALPHAQLWFLKDDHGPVVMVDRATLKTHARPFEEDFKPVKGVRVGDDIGAALDRAAREQRPIVVALHGGDSEDGTLARWCEARRAAFTGSGSLACAAAFDKGQAKRLVARAGVPVLPSLFAGSGDTPCDEVVAQWLAEHHALVLKPIADGSSNGLHIINHIADWRQASGQGLGAAHLIEPLARGIEVTVGVVDVGGSLLALEPVEVRPAGVFDYAAKYLDLRTTELCPSTLDASQVQEVCRMAITAHLAVGSYGYSRTDLIVTNSGPVFLEINSLPGLASSSLLPTALAHAGVGLREFIEQQISLAIARATLATLATLATITSQEPGGRDDDAASRRLVE